MKSLQCFSVQPIASDGLPDKNTCIYVEAANPIQAAELALGETFALNGKPGTTGALVWKLADDYTPISIPLFRAD